MPLKLYKFLLPLLLSTPCLLAESPQCFHFTWIGPYANKTNIRQESCEARVGDFNHIPCEMPLVATANDKAPDAKAMWTNTTIQREQYLCQMTPGFSCVKYSYVFKGGIQNITYMCARVNSSSGCYRHTHSTGMQVEACVCNSKLGLMPCNGTATMQLYQLLGWAGCLLSILQFCRVNKHKIF